LRERSVDDGRIAIIETRIPDVVDDADNGAPFVGLIGIDEPQPPAYRVTLREESPRERSRNDNNAWCGFAIADCELAASDQRGPERRKVRRRSGDEIRAPLTLRNIRLRLHLERRVPLRGNRREPRRAAGTSHARQCRDGFNGALRRRRAPTRSRLMDQEQMERQEPFGIEPVIGLQQPHEASSEHECASENDDSSADLRDHEC